MASSNFNDDAYSNTGSIEGMESDVKLEEIAALDEISDDNLSEEVDDEITNFDENEVQGLADISQSVKRKTLTQAKRLKRKGRSLVSLIKVSKEQIIPWFY